MKKFFIGVCFFSFTFSFFKASFAWESFAKSKFFTNSDDIDCAKEKTVNKTISGIVCVPRFAFNLDVCQRFFLANLQTCKIQRKAKAAAKRAAAKRAAAKRAAAKRAAAKRAAAKRAAAKRAAAKRAAAKRAAAKRAAAKRAAAKRKVVNGSDNNDPQLAMCRAGNCFGITDQSSDENDPRCIIGTYGVGKAFQYNALSSTEKQKLTNCVQKLESQSDQLCREQVEGLKKLSVVKDFAKNSQSYESLGHKLVAQQVSYADFNDHKTITYNLQLAARRADDSRGAIRGALSQTTIWRPSAYEQGGSINVRETRVRVGCQIVGWSALNTEVLVGLSKKISGMPKAQQEDYSRLINELREELNALKNWPKNDFASRISRIEAKQKIIAAILATIKPVFYVYGNVSYFGLKTMAQITPMAPIYDQYANLLISLTFDVRIMYSNWFLGGEIGTTVIPMKVMGKDTVMLTLTGHVKYEAMDNRLFFTLRGGLLEPAFNFDKNISYTYRGLPWLEFELSVRIVGPLGIRLGVGWTRGYLEPGHAVHILTWRAGLYVGSW